MIGRMLPDGDTDGEHEANQNHSIRNLQLAALVETENSIESTSSIVNGVPADPKCRNSRSSTP
jgi:hypothetical protein